MAGESTRLGEEKKKQVANAVVDDSSPRARSYPSVRKGDK